MFEVKMPELTDSELMARYQQVKPVVRDEKDALLKWVKGYNSPSELRETAYLWAPTYLREVSRGELMAIHNYDFLCLHTWGAPGLFKPTIAEVLSQLDYDEISKDIFDVDTGIKMKVVAFEIIDYPKDSADLYKDYLTSTLFNMGYHVSTVRLYTSYKSFSGFPEGA